MKKFITAAMVFAATVLLAGCCNNIDLEGKWELASLNGENVKATETQPFIEFDTESGKVHGHTGCNIINGGYTLDGKKLTFGNMATTMMAGPDMELEGKVLEALGKTASVKADGKDRIILSDTEGNALMVFGRK